MIKEFLELGQIVGTHGVRGEMRLNPWCDSPEFAAKFKTVYFDEKGTQPVKVVSCRPHGNVALIRLTGVNSANDAEKMRNTVLYIRRGDAHLPHGTWFISELIGCEVYDADDRTHVYGTLSEVMQTGANDVWAVKENNGREYLVPAVKSVVIETDVEQNSVYIRPLKGIFDDAD